MCSSICRYLWPIFACIVLIGIKSLGSEAALLTKVRTKPQEKPCLRQQPCKPFYGEIFGGLCERTKGTSCIIVVIWLKLKDGRAVVRTRPGWRSWTYFIFWRFFFATNTLESYEYSRHQVGYCASFSYRTPVAFIAADVVDKPLPWTRNLKRQTLKPGLSHRTTYTWCQSAYWQLGDHWTRLYSAASRDGRTVS